MPKWTSEQLTAINQENSNIIVSASAGSGKTAVLTSRVIRKLQSGISIDQLLILTFTKAAAKEMKERIKSGIEKENLTENLKLLNKAYITTFDSYALSIVKRYHYLLQISPRISIEEGGILKIQAKKILDAIFEEMYEKEEPNFVSFINDFCVKDDTEIRKLLLNIYDKLDLRMDKNFYLQNYIETYYQDSVIEKDVESYLQLIKEKITDLKAFTNILVSYAETDYQEAVLEILEPLFHANTYEEIKNLSIIAIPSLPRNSEPELKELKDKISKKLLEIQELCNYDDVDQIAYLIKETKKNTKVIVSLLQELDKRLLRFKKENELYSFNDIAKMAIQVLQENPSIKEELKNSFNEIMIDEYQDTSDIQEEFIHLIENNNVYMVGDIKQSIYRFRNANPYIFKNKYDSYKNHQGGEKIDLSKNFRSRNEVIEDINLLFSDIMDDHIGGADYLKEHAMIFGNQAYLENMTPNNHLEIYDYSNILDSGYTKEEIEIFTIANDIKQKIESNYQVMDKKMNQLRKAKYSDFVILINKSKNFLLYKKIFEYLGLPLTIERDSDLLNNININIIKNICELIVLEKNKTWDANYDFDFLSIGRSYLFEYDDATLFQMVTSKNYTSTLKDIVEQMVPYLKENIHVFLEKLFDLLNIYEKIIKIGNVEENILVIDYLKTMAESLENLGYGIEEFIEYLANLKEQGLNLKYTVSDHFEDSVKIMTIHGSKGLEYPICYYSGLYSKFNIRELNEKILLSDRIIIPYIDGYYRKTIYYYLLKDKYMKEEISEQIRLFYVALTRAREKMIIVGEMEDKNTLKENHLVLDRLNYRSFKDILCSIKPILEPYIQLIDLNNIPITKNYQFVKKNEYQNESAPSFEVTELPIQNSELNEIHFSKEQVKVITEKEYDLYHFGNYVHSILEQLDFKKPDFSSVDLPNLYIEKIKTFLNCDLFLEPIETIYKEYEFIDQDQLGKIDLILETKSTLKIVDYKLKNIDDPMYEEQLRGYQNYLQTISNKKIELYLYSILNSELKKIE